MHSSRRKSPVKISSCSVARRDFILVLKGFKKVAFYSLKFFGIKNYTKEIRRGSVTLYIFTPHIAIKAVDTPARFPS
jgi:hypothetical protein